MILYPAIQPARGFLLHSYGGSAELVPQLVDLGAYFSFSGYFLHEKKYKTRKAFSHIPSDRLLIETDAPDMLPPEDIISHPLSGNLNHPANLTAIHHAAAQSFDVSKVDRNFDHFFQQ